jgi:spermidine dehydrogenase
LFRSFFEHAGRLAFGIVNDDAVRLTTRVWRVTGYAGHGEGFRYDLLNTSLETFERNIRDQLARTLNGGGFDPAEDIVAITVNRWPHGYSYTYNSLYDPMEWVYTSSPDRPCVIARQPFGRITIANADAAASPHTDAAILEAYRAVTEVVDRRAMPLLS